MLQFIKAKNKLMEGLDKELTTPVDPYCSDENLTPLEVCEKINRLSGLNIFTNTRKREVIEMRALACYILRDKLFMKLQNIAKFFTDQGRKMHHASCLHLLKNYSMYKSNNKNLDKFEKTFFFKPRIPYEDVDRANYLENKYLDIEEKYLKLRDKLKNPLVKLILDVKDEDVVDLMNTIKLRKKSYDWKNKYN